MASRPLVSPHLEKAGKPSLGDVSFVVPTCRRPEALRLTLSALLAVEYPSSGYEIVVVDDGSTVEQVVADFLGGPVAVHYRAQSGRGAAATRNLGAQVASGELLVFCDDDVVVSPDHVRRHLDAQRCFERALVNGISSLPPETLAEFESTPFGRYRLELERSYEAEADVDPLGQGRFATSLLSARNLSIRRDVFWEIGGFDEGFPWAGAEDQDLSLRAERAGCTLIRDHNIRVVHNEQILSVSQFCTREERSAETIVVLSEKYPEETRRRALFQENAHVRVGEGLGSSAKKALKSLFATSLVLAVLDRIVPLLDRLPVPERALHRIYRGLVGLHIFRGVRGGLQKQSRGRTK